MSLTYHLVKRTVALGPEKGREKFFAQIRAGKVISMDKICQRVHKQSTASPGDVHVVVRTLLDVLYDILYEGNIAQVGGLGNFRLSAGSKGADSGDDFNTSLFKMPRVIFVPGKHLRHMLPDVQFSRLQTIQRETVKDAVEPPGKSGLKCSLQSRVK